MQVEEEFLLSVTFPADEAGLLDRLQFDQTGLVQLTLESNELNPSAQSIGKYQMLIGPDKALQLKQTLVDIDRHGLPAGEMVPPGSDMVTVTLKQGDQEESRIIDPACSAPAICAMANELRDIALKTASSGPINVIAMDVTAREQQVEQGSPLSIRVLLKSMGSKDVAIVDPLEPPADKTQAGRLILWAVRSDLPPAELWPHHSIHSELTAELATESKQPEQENPGMLKLKPQQMAGHIFQQPVDWEPGAYAVKVILETLTSGSDKLHGKIISQPLTVRITEKPQ